jgi:hypothetical protein
MTLFQLQSTLSRFPQVTTRHFYRFLINTSEPMQVIIEKIGNKSRETNTVRAKKALGLKLTKYIGQSYELLSPHAWLKTESGKDASKETGISSINLYIILYPKLDYQKHIKIRCLNPFRKVGYTIFVKRLTSGKKMFDTIQFSTHPVSSNRQTL